MGVPPQVIGVAAGVGQSALAIGGQKAKAKAQATAQARQTKAERARYIQQVNAERISQRFEMEQRSQQLQVASMKALQARSQARMAAGDAGVSGGSVDALLRDFSRQEAAYRFGLTRQGEQANIGRDLRVQDFQHNSYQRMLGINQPIEQPNYGAAILSGVTTGISVASGLKDL